RLAEGEPAQAEPAGRGVLDGGEPPGAVAAGPPLRGAVLDVGVEHVAAALEADRDGVGGAPLVEAVGGEEAEQGVELLALANESARRAQGVVERELLQRLAVVGGLRGRGDEAADLAGLAAGVGGHAVAEVLADLPRLRGGGAVVDALPARV